ncbi:AraC family transcriptional regulator [Paenibacillus sp. HN-1]|uniref:AraC family transcriptional regulator n=1 Tax=Paenibacillus TaxID=44249 RepID=UPI001CA8CF60|nr:MULTISPECIES: AraC family transcriptional regulator [Paenibacillus]MBY9080303.1 AraC family transcriptional regulator [Paenibacillus sp. CGMCC 1.18879]MBY9083038.1 AraC family transcriptional regulator [Paenibacillus sinensis]
MKAAYATSQEFKERVQHGNKDFQLQLYRDIEHYEQGLIFYNHWHEEAEILYVVDGEMELVVDGVSIFAKKNTVVLIPPNLLHVAYQCHDRKCRFTSIVFHSDFIASKNEDKIQTTQLNPFLVNTFISSYVLKASDRSNEIVQQLLAEFERSYQGDQSYRELLLKGYLCQILFHLLQKEEIHNVKTASDYLNEVRKKKIISFIEENYQNAVSLNDLANVISLSKEQFCRFFKQSFRSTPINYLNQHRINRAMDLLKRTNLSIIDIAIEVGFDSSNHFSIAFKKTTGMTPSHFRKMT